MANIRGIISRFTGGRGATRGRTKRGPAKGGLGTGSAGAGAGGRRRAEDEAVGRGVRGLLSRFRR
jgi:hypothetical protein